MAMWYNYVERVTNMNQEPFDREKFTADFENWLKENREKVEATFITLEELANDPDFLEDEPYDEYYSQEAMNSGKIKV